MTETQFESLAARLDAMERRALAAERKGRLRARLGSLALFAALLIVGAPQAGAQMGITLASLSARVDALTASLNKEKADRASGDTALGNRATALEAKTQFMLVDGSNTIFRGTNVMVQSGSGSTEGAVNGKGNLIIGYNEARGLGSNQGGSHNLVIGMSHNYSSYCGVIAGQFNSISAPYASVLGALASEAQGKNSVVIGGQQHLASGEYAAIFGGKSNSATGYSSSVLGSERSVSSGNYSTISAGLGNSATVLYASVFGGADNTASGTYSVVAGGLLNLSSGQYSSVTGGLQNNEDRRFGWRSSPTVKN